MVAVLFVCMGNICRSPLAEGAFRALVDTAGLSDRFEIESAGTINFHAGKPPDPRSVETAFANGFDISSQRARQITADDLTRFDHILVMDRANWADVMGLADSAGLAADARGHIRPFLDFARHIPMDEIPDPYGGHGRDFELVARLVKDAGQGLLDSISKDKGF